MYVILKGSMLPSVIHLAILSEGALDECFLLGGYIPYPAKVPSTAR
jgi:hypothetical protein